MTLAVLAMGESIAEISIVSPDFLCPQIFPRFSEAPSDERDGNR